MDHRINCIIILFSICFGLACSSTQRHEGPKDHAFRPSKSFFRPSLGALAAKKKVGESSLGRVISSTPSIDSCPDLSGYYECSNKTVFRDSHPSSKESLAHLVDTYSMNITQENASLDVRYNLDIKTKEGDHEEVEVFSVSDSLITDGTKQSLETGGSFRRSYCEDQSVITSEVYLYYPTDEDRFDSVGFAIISKTKEGIKVKATDFSTDFNGGVELGYRAFYDSM